MKIAADKRRKGIKIILSGIHTQPYILFEKTEMVNKIGRENIFGEIQEAIDYASKL